MVTVDFAEFTDKCTADGMGLISGKTGLTFIPELFDCESNA